MKGAFLALAFCLWFFGQAFGQNVNEQYVVTLPRTVEKMMDVADVRSTDVVYDLGSGDGRIVVAAAKRGARAVGVEIDPFWVDVSRRNIEANKFVNATIVRGDFYKTSLSAATVIMLFLGSRVLQQLSGRLRQQLYPGVRIVSNALPLPGWEPMRIVDVNQLLRDPDNGRWFRAPLFVYVR